ncbi:membrane protein [Streptomyces noursei ATCC 11455]|nr:membrane protein [Streptomyces noursei ATCC 11455]
MEVAAVLALGDYWGKRNLRYSGVAVLLGVGTVAVTDLMFLVVQIEGGDYTPFLWLWIGLAVWAIWALWTLTRQRVWRGIPHPKGVALSVVVSGAIGVASLGYSQLYVPYTTPVRIPFAISFGDPTMSADGSLLHVPVHFTIRNTGSVSAFVLGASWVALGSPTRFDAKGSTMRDWKRDVARGAATVRHVVFYPSHMRCSRYTPGRFGGSGRRARIGENHRRTAEVWPRPG